MGYDGPLARFPAGKADGFFREEDFVAQVCEIFFSLEILSCLDGKPFCLKVMPVFVVFHIHMPKVLA